MTVTHLLDVAEYIESKTFIILRKLSEYLISLKFLNFRNVNLIPLNPKSFLRSSVLILISQMFNPVTQGICKSLRLV